MLAGIHELTEIINHIWGRNQSIWKGCQGKSQTDQDMELQQGDEMDEEEEKGKKTTSQPQSKAFFGVEI